METEEVIHLYTTKDVAQARKILLEEQNSIDPITGLVIPEKQAVLDHDHTTQYVRAVLHRQTNSVLGKIENLWVRYLGWWYTGTLPQFLRGCADYLEREQPRRYVHPKFQKRLQTDFNKLPEASKRSVLRLLGSSEGSNAAERKKLFASVLKSKFYTFEKVQELIKKETT